MKQFIQDQIDRCGISCAADILASHHIEYLDDGDIQEIITLFEADKSGPWYATFVLSSCQESSNLKLFSAEALRRLVDLQKKYTPDCVPEALRPLIRE